MSDSERPDPASMPPSAPGEPRAQLDWSSMAVLLAENSGRPLVLLDQDGRIRLLSSAMEQVIGWRGVEVEGRYWWDVCGPPGSADRARAWMDQMLRGVRRTQECELIARSGARLLVRSNVFVSGREHARSVLLSVEAVAPVDSAEGCLSAEDGDYVVTRVADGFGRLHDVAAVGRRLMAPRDERLPCYTVLAQRDSACTDCPFLLPEADPWPRVIVRRRRKDDGFEVVTGEALDGTIGRIRVRNVSDGVLGAIHEAKVRVLGDKARLSDRERSVLEYLRMGRSLDEIAGILGLSRRTVKFHQANILQKLGADSRFHLISLAGL